MDKHGRHHHHTEGDDDKVENKILNYLKTLKKQIMGALEDNKAALEITNEKLDIIATGFAGVKKDIAFIKKKLEASPGGIDAAGAAELLASVNAINAKADQVGIDIAAVDAETDSTEEETPQG